MATTKKATARKTTKKTVGTIASGKKTLAKVVRKARTAATKIVTKVKKAARSRS